MPEEWHLALSMHTDKLFSEPFAITRMSQGTVFA
jgi:hypothetical protein